MFLKIAFYCGIACFLLNLTHSASLRDSNSTRSKTCNSILGLNVCVNVGSSNQAQVTVGGVNIIEQPIFMFSEKEYCVGALGFEICIKSNFYGNRGCIVVSAKAPLIGSGSANFGCIDLSIIG